MPSKNQKMKSKKTYASMGRDELIQYAADYISKNMTDGWFDTNKHNNFSGMCYHYNIMEEARHKSGASKHAPKWATMSKEKLLDYAIKYIKENSENGSFTSRSHDTFYSAMRRHGVYKEALRRSGVSHRKSYGLHKMTKSERLNYIMEYLTKNSENGIFTRAKHSAAYQSFKKYDGLLEESLEKLGIRMGHRINYAAMGEKGRMEYGIKYIIENSENGVFPPSGKKHKKFIVAMRKYGIYNEIIEKSGIEPHTKVLARKRVERKKIKEAQERERSIERERIRERNKREKGIERERLREKNRRENFERRKREKTDRERAKKAREEKDKFRFQSTSHTGKLKEAVGYIEVHSSAMRFDENRHQDFARKAKNSGLLFLALLKAEVIPISSKDDFFRFLLRNLKKKMHAFEKNGFSECKTLAELIATHVARHARESFSPKNSFSDISILMHIRKNMLELDIPLNTFTQVQLDELLKDLSEKRKRDIFLYLHKVMEHGIKNSVVIPCAIERNSVNKSLFMESVRRNLTEPSTLLEWCAVLWKEKIVYEKVTVEFLIARKKMPIQDFSYQELLGFRSRFWKKRVIKQWRSIFVKNFVRPLMEKGVLEEGFLDRSKFDGFFREHMKNRKKVKKRNRTVMWYALEYHTFSNRTHKLCLESSPQTKRAFLNTFEFVADLSAKDFSWKHLEHIRSRSNARVGFLRAINAMIDDGLVSPDIFYQAKQNILKEFDFSSDLWNYRVRSKIDFSKIKNDSLREAMKHYIWVRTDGLKENLHGGITKHFDLMQILSGMGVKELVDLNGDVQKRFYLYLSERDAKEGGSTPKGLLKIFRSFIRVLKKIEYEGVSDSLILNNDNFRLKQSTQKITVYTDIEMRKILKIIKSHKNRLMGCAIGMQALFARRISETFSYPEPHRLSGFKVDTLRKIGLSGEYFLVVEHPKQGKIDAIPLSAMAGNRSDPFGCELIELGISLFQEAIRITESYRHLAPEALQDYLFIEEKQHGGYGLIRGPVVRTELKKQYKNYKINTSRTIHEFRHTMATNIILSGGTIGDAADALSDTVDIVAKHYHSYAEKVDTLKFFGKMGRSQMVDPLEDSRFFKKLERGRHKVVLRGELNSEAKAVVGGNCIAPTEEMLSCPGYMMINGESGCPGCKSFVVEAVANKEYWEIQKKNKLKEMDASRSESWWFEKARAGYEQAKSMLEDIEQKELEDEFGN